VIQLARYLKSKIKIIRWHIRSSLVCPIPKISRQTMLMQGCVSNRDNGWKLSSCSRVTVCLGSIEWVDPGNYQIYQSIKTTECYSQTMRVPHASNRPYIWLTNWSQNWDIKLKSVSAWMSRINRNNGNCMENEIPRAIPVDQELPVFRNSPRQR